MTKRPMTAAALALALLATGCTTAVHGEPLALPEPPPPVPVPEEPALWASTQLDPCKLLPGTSLREFNPGPAYLTRPHHCGREMVLPGTGLSRVVVRVGTSFDHIDRMRGEPVTINGLIAYQRLNLGRTVPDCQVDLPLSATVSIQTSAPTNERTTSTGCATARAAANDVTHAVRDLASVRRAPGKLLGHWDTCALMNRALQTTSAQRMSIDRTQDTCSVGQSFETSTEVEMTTGPEPVAEMRAKPEVHQGVKAVQLNGVEATQSDGVGRCYLNWAQEPSATPHPDYEVHRAKLQAPNCGTAVDAANKIRAVLSGEPPAPPPAPGSLGFPEGARDENTDPACQVVNHVTPETCRAPKDVAVPKGIEANLREADGPNGADIGCAMLAAALRVVTNQEPITTVYGTTCIGRPKDFTLSVQLGTYAPGAASSYCAPKHGREEVSTAGRPTVSCGANDANRDLTIALRGSLDAKGVLLVNGRLDNPRGVSTDKPKDAEKVKLVDRIAEYVLEQYFDR